MGKINTSDGSFTLQKLISAVTTCKAIGLSSDNSYVYVAGTNLGSAYIYKLNFGDYSMVSVTSPGANTVSSIYTYSYGGNTDMLLINGFSTVILATQYDIVAANMATSSISFAKAFT